MRLIVALTPVALFACGGARDLPRPPHGGVPPEVRVGLLVHDPLPPVKSVRAYLGDAFRLQTAAGEVVLGPSAAVPAERLADAAGRVVSVLCDLRPPAPPGPHESFPQGPDGRPLERPPVCEVHALEIPPTR